ncbi:MAG: hypothetical protein SGILL_006971, partial [Bacillariaceae sp.]
MFYEALSDFFYDPKSKLYYGNRKGAYFRYDATLDAPSFVEVQKVANPSAAGQDGAQSTMDQLPIHSTTSSTKTDVAAKPKIAIKLKTKKIKTKTPSVPSSSTVVETAPAISKKQKEQIANIGKWTEKQAELKQEQSGSASVTAALSRDSNQAASRGTPAVADTSKVRMTAKGEPICIVCKRKFPNIDKLRLHERASELHKKNLQKQKQQEQADRAKLQCAEGRVMRAPAPAATAGYQDRAQKRRQLHGPDTLPDRHTANIMLHDHQEPTPSAQALDESHVGHQMLQKMGWKGDGKDSNNGD